MSTITFQAQPPALPPEILALIVDHLVAGTTVPYTEHHAEDDGNLNYDGQGNFINDATFDLKNASLVSRTWRQAVWPLLFKHVYIRYLDWEPHSDKPCEPVTSAVDFLNANYTSLKHVVQSVSIFIQPSERLLAKSREAREVAPVSSRAWRSDLQREEEEASQSQQWTLHDPYGPLLDAISSLPSIKRITIIAPPTVAEAFLCKKSICYPPVGHKRHLLHIMTLEKGQKMPSQPGPAAASMATSNVPLQRFLYRGVGERLIMNAGWDSLPKPESPSMGTEGWRQRIKYDQSTTFETMRCRCGRMTNEYTKGYDNLSSKNSFRLVSYPTIVAWACYHGAGFMSIQVPPGAVSVNFFTKCTMRL